MPNEIDDPALVLEALALTGAALVAWTVPTSRDPDAHKTDVPGLVLSTAAVAVLTYTLIEAPNYGWSSGRSLAGFAVAAGLFAAFIVRERSTAEPMLDLSLFRNLRFTAASGSVTVVFFALSGFSFLITQYFQFFRGYGPLATGVRLLPVAISVGVMSVVGTKLAVRFGTKQVVTAGLFCSAAFFELPRPTPASSPSITAAVARTFAAARATSGTGPAAASGNGRGEDDVVIEDEEDEEVVDAEFTRE